MRRDWRKAGWNGLFLFLCATFGLSLTAPGCAPQPIRVTRQPTTLRLVAAASCVGLAEESASAYQTAYPWVTVTVERLNNASAVDALQRGTADLAFLSWGGVEQGSRPLWMEAFIRDGVAVIVEPSSAFSEVGLVELREIFLGRLQERAGVELTVVSREAGSGTRAAFESIVLGGESPTLNAVVVPSSEAMMAYVSGTAGAIGYVSTPCLDDRVRALPVEGVLPSEEAIASGSYPLWRDLQLASKGEPAGEARRFAQWLLSGGAAADLAPVGSVSP